MRLEGVPIRRTGSPAVERAGATERRPVPLPADPSSTEMMTGTSDNLVGDLGRGPCSVESDRAELSHLCLEDRAAGANLFFAGLTTPRWIARIVGHQTLLLRRFIDVEEKDPLEQVDDLRQVQRDAAHEHGLVGLGYKLLKPFPAPHPAMRPQPRLIGCSRPVLEQHPVTGLILPERQERVVVGIDGRESTKRSSLATVDLPDPGFPVTRNTLTPHILPSGAATPSRRSGSPPPERSGATEYRPAPRRSVARSRHASGRVERPSGASRASVASKGRQLLGPSVTRQPSDPAPEVFRSSAVYFAAGSLWPSALLIAGLVSGEWIPTSLAVVLLATRALWGWQRRLELVGSRLRIPHSRGAEIDLRTASLRIKGDFIAPLVPWPVESIELEGPDMEVVVVTPATWARSRSLEIRIFELVP